MDTMFLISAMIFAGFAIFAFRKLRARSVLKRIDYIVLSAFTLFSLYAAMQCLETIFPSIFFLVNGQPFLKRTLLEEFVVFLYYYGCIFGISALFDYIFIVFYFNLRGFNIANTMTVYALLYTLCATPTIFL